VVAVVAGERIEENRRRLQREHVEVRRRDEQPPASGAEAAVWKREQRVHEHGEDEVRGENADRVGNRAVRLVQHADQRGEADRGQQQAEAAIRAAAEGDHARPDEREADDCGEQRLCGGAGGDPADGDHGDRRTRRGERGEQQRDGQHRLEPRAGAFPRPVAGGGGALSRRPGPERLLVHFSRLASSAPERSAFETKPRAPLASISGP
jgi:hypothetical protein